MIDLVGILGLNSYHPLRYDPDQGPLNKTKNQIDGNDPLKTADNIKTMDDLVHMQLPKQTPPAIVNKAAVVDGDDENNNPTDQADGNVNIGYGWTALTVKHLH